MNHHLYKLSACLLAAATLSYAAVGTQSAAAAADDAARIATLAAALPAPVDCSPQPLTPLQQRLLDKAAGGTGALRQFLTLNHEIFQLDTLETMRWVEHQQVRQAACVMQANRAAR